MRDPIPILYEDEGWIVFEKPAGFLVIPTPKKEKNTLMDIVNREYKAKHKVDFGLHPCHRLDRDTSGVIIFAKGKKHQQVMMEMFRQRKILKKYIAFVHGRVRHPAGEIKSVIKDYTERKFERRFAPERSRRGERKSGRERAGKLAVTRYKVLERRNDYTILEVQPLTGRTNQIRIHFSDLGHPLVGERQYAFGKDYALKFRRAALHASSLEWIHPVSHEKAAIDSGLPPDMQNFMERN